MMRLALVLLAGLIAAAPAPAMTGDGEAIAMARRMIGNMGGRERWARARWIYAREEAWFADRASPSDAQYWRRTTRPGGRSLSVGPGWRREFFWEDGAGYRIVDGVRSQLARADLLDQAGWWPADIYTMYVRLAREDSDLRLVRTTERSFRVLDDASGANLGEYFVDATGSLRRWRFGFGNGAVDYIYGPLRAFGDIRVPSWGSLADGSFRFFYTEFRLAERDDEVSFAAPR